MGGGIQPPMGVGPNVGMKMKEGVEDSQESLWQPPINQRERITWAICLPLKVVSHYTMPNCRLDKWKNWFLASFFISMLWISIFSYVMVWMITIIGKFCIAVVYLPFFSTLSNRLNMFCGYPLYFYLLSCKTGGKQIVILIPDKWMLKYWVWLIYT